MKEIIKNNKYRLLSIIVAFVYNFIASRPNSNLLMFISSLIFMLAITYINFDFLEVIESKSKIIFTLSIVSTFAAYLFEAIFSSSFYLNDMIVQNYSLSVVAFVFRFIYFISNIVLIFHILDLKKNKYLFFSIFNIFFSICLYIEVISFLIPVFLILEIIILIIIEYLEKKNENKKRFD
ncbi:hypothetical protein STFE110948_00660 [Streptobacillus felis]|uniref:hypothetical protein n=1 Tax=Streptobacillus felis TaxID=1384509 RepID=UPI0008298DBF|nr:hypothetical protein [Streptobacillus felis]